VNYVEQDIRTKIAIVNINIKNCINNLKKYTNASVKHSINTSLSAEKARLEEFKIKYPEYFI